QVLGEVLRHRAGADVLVVDDGSTDDTPSRLQAVQGVRVVRHPRNLGYGAALMAGFRVAAEEGYDQVVTIDCDGQHEPRLLGTFFETLERGWDVVSGSRYLPGSPVQGQPPADRVRINRQFTERLNRLTGLGLTDSFCGFKGYRVAALRRLHLSEPGYGFPLQVWVEAWRHRLSVVELPVPRIYKDNFQRRFGGTLDRPEVRCRYYEQVLASALRCPRCAEEALAGCRAACGGPMP
ncbi:MAG TPA: glycosyltransferase family 2 protein, partial [Limnochordales bacterium]